MSKNILGIDYGSKKTGLAISQDSSLPLGFKTISGNKQEIIKQIKQITAQHSIKLIVLGLPESEKFNQPESQKHKITQFKNQLAKAVPQIKIETADERMSSKLAGRYSDKEKEHQEAARIILEDWMRKGADK
ncbi:MAG: RuvX/YqgF family protein [Patescibacteria group bacterium]|nr:RuvX/YqgF family protein [Patescibacteria group bacterium]